MKQNVALDTEGGLENPVCQGQGGHGTAVQCLGHYEYQWPANEFSGV